MQSYWRLHKYPILFAIACILFYWSFAYNLVRTDYVKLFMLFGALFYLCHKLIQFEKWNFKFLLVIGILFRLVFLIAVPNLSQDFYRFIWDGELIKNGINPYLYTPDQIISQGTVFFDTMQELYKGMSTLNARHYSNYPPVNQLLFAFATIFGGGSVMGSMIAMRVIIILADLGTLYFGRKLLQNLNKANHMAFWYFLNPLVIIELTGNLHFEGVMLFFLVWSLYLISQNKWQWATPLYACSIMVKLIPLLFLPIFLKYFRLKKSVFFYILILLGCAALLLPFYSPVFIDNYSKTVGLWFSNFEFNAGIYNVVKKIAVSYYEAKPWELIDSYGSILTRAIIIIVLLLAFLRRNQKLESVITTMVLLLASYYFLSSTVHPWYVVFLLGIAIFTNYRFPLIWSCTVILSYYAYSNPEYKENLWLLTIEYIVVIGYFVYEMIVSRPKKLYFYKK
ncbi:polyprenol phosphomannose-dependent alpha 1,6 mannosyltransferase MptB [Allomuricauda sp. F6463D]|uniref:polyprenol phosphomannose-dependent alpha 1,6 mannosyltransferase MptB n=1 Tax=Allomuricauda sp. F6463D TaxID=2926409 RepID=UPI001FF2AA35|nr:polyprenol phosphomannose-dependent alpha 1,6 mannosyltransferase MptB [Muricauda sp. F6463D]MCK0161558.1 polyprenol phosphomannose-dependent alpha 1,6 mannosyltransferase MptB [Muricauda sp. F6463D]